MIRLTAHGPIWDENCWKVQRAFPLGPKVQLTTPNVTRTLAFEGGRMPLEMRVAQQRTEAPTQEEGEQTILLTVEVIRDLPEEPESSRAFSVTVGNKPGTEHPWTIRVGRGGVLYTWDGLLVPGIKFKEGAFVQLFPLASSLSEPAWRACDPLIGLRVEGKPDRNIFRVAWWQLTAARRLLEPWLEKYKA